MYNYNYPEEPTDEAKVISEDYDAVLLGENDLGSVHLHGPYGNVESEITVAYNIGMHPLESKSHRALFEVVEKRSNELNYKYYIYNINVKGELSTETEGRMEGQLLAQEFVAPHIINGSYDFFVDVHSNRGSKGPGSYKITNFIFAPGFDDNSTKIMNVLISKISEIEYYAPEFRSSPEYITIPVVNSGIPTIVYETYSYEDMKKTYSLAEELVKQVDNLELNS